MGRLWNTLGVAQKIGVAFAVLICMTVVIACVNLVALHVVRQAEADILASMELRQRVYEMDSELEKARRHYMSFILNYPRIGFAEAQAQHSQPSVTAMARVIVISEDLKRRINASNVSETLRSHNVDLNLYLTSAKRFSKVFLEFMELVTVGVDPVDGVQPRMQARMQELASIVERSDRAALIHARMQMLERDYFLTRQRSYMQSAFNVSFALDAFIRSSNLFDARQQLVAHELLRDYAAAAEQLLDLDTAITSKTNEFALQVAALDPISQSLKQQASMEVEAARRRIEGARSTAVVLTLVMAVLGISCALGIGYVIRGSVTQRIVALTRCASALQAGNLSVRSEPGLDDELGALSETFNVMAARVKDLVDNLEEKVRARTLELAAKNLELDEKNHTLEILSLTDRLTGLSNRHKIDQVLHSELLRAKRYGKLFSVIILDVDRFKSVNDTYGHHTGDSVLVQLARILEGELRETDTLGRWGGEEFMVICPESGLADTATMAERMRLAIMDHLFPLVGRVTASFGVAAYQTEDEAHSLITRADDALYRAKHKGRNRVELALL